LRNQNIIKENFMIISKRLITIAVKRSLYLAVLAATCTLLLLGGMAPAMATSLNSSGMADQVEGTVDQVKGKAKRDIGKLQGQVDSVLNQAEGAADQVKGKAKQDIGKTKNAAKKADAQARDTTNNLLDAAKDLISR
jgi:uncharacterized protein YjbJ (UPF0337 family)